MTLTVFPVLRKNATLMLEYSQGFDDTAQGLNNAQGAILKSSGTPLLFGLSDVTLTASVEDNSEDEDNDGDDNDNDDDDGG